MSLNIKDRDAHRLAEELAKLTGESMTTAVTIAVRERFDQVRQVATVPLLLRNFVATPNWASGKALVVPDEYRL